MMFPLCPDKRKDCRFTHGPTTTTLMSWEPEFNHDGKLLNPDINNTTSTIHCSVCDRTWENKTQGRKIQIKLLANSKEVVV